VSVGGPRLEPPAGGIGFLGAPVHPDAATVDADLAVLGSGRQRYARYCQEIRNEYAHVPERQFRSRRAETLTTLLEHEHLFASPQGRGRWEAAARRNVDAEIRQLVPLNSV